MACGAQCLANNRTNFCAPIICRATLEPKMAWGALLVLVDADQRRIGISPHYLHKNTNKARELSVNCYQLSGIRYQVSGIRFKPPSETSLLDERQIANEREVIRRQARERMNLRNFSPLWRGQRSTGEENPRTPKRGRLAAPLLVKCSRRLVQCRSGFGHAKRNCASEAYEPPLRFGMIASSKAATSSNST